MQVETYREPADAAEAWALERCKRKLEACAAEGFISSYVIHGFVGDGRVVSFSVDGQSKPRRVEVGPDWLWLPL